MAPNDLPARFQQKAPNNARLTEPRDSAATPSPVASAAFPVADAQTVGAISDPRAKLQHLSDAARVVHHLAKGVDAP